MDIRNNEIFEDLDVTDSLVMAMVSGEIPNYLVIGNYVVIGGIKYRFAYFDRAYAILIPDETISRPSMVMCKLDINSGMDYIKNVILPRSLGAVQAKFPVLNARLMTVDDIENLPMFRYNIPLIKSCNGDSYFIENPLDNSLYTYIDPNGNIDVGEYSYNMGIRPAIYIGYTIYHTPVEEE